MITQPPEEQAARANVPRQPASPKTPDDYLYPKKTTAPQVITTAPVVTPAQEEEKYQAWLKAKQTPKKPPLLSKDDLQNFIYTFEAGLLGAGLYEIYRRK